MTKEEAWLVWINATKTTDTPIETDFEVIKKTSWWAAFSAGWDAAAVNLNGWDNAYMMGVQAGKEIAQPEQEPLEYKEECWACGCEECICATKVPGYYESKIKEAVLAECEACAKLLEDAAFTGTIISCTSAAKAIRARHGGKE